MRYFTVYKENIQSEYEVAFAEGLTCSHFQLSMNAIDDYVEENRQLLIDWLIHFNHFPLTVYIAAYKDMYESPGVFLTSQEISFEKVIIATEQKPVYIIELKNKAQLTEVISEFFWLPAQNEMMLLTNCRNAVELTEWKVSSKLPYTNLGATLNLFKEDCMVIEIQHDGQGIGITSTSKSFGTAKGICDHFPKGYTVQQWDDDVLIPYEI